MKYQSVLINYIFLNLIEKNMKFFLHHTTQYSYSNPVVESANKILLYPFNDMNQQLVNHNL